MKNVIVLVVALAAIGCKKKQTAEPAPSVGSSSGSSMAGSSSGSAGGSSAGSGSAMAGSQAGSDGSAGSGSGSGSGGYKMTKDTTEPPKSDKTGFAPVDEAMAGKSPWLSDAAAKAGVVELIADDDLSGRTKGTFTTKRLCGDAAKSAVAKAGEIIAKRSKDPAYDQTDCRENGMDPNKVLCLSGGLGEGDFSVVLDYRKAGDTWSVVGVQNTGVGINTEKQDAQYEKLLATKCK